MRSDLPRGIVLAALAVLAGAASASCGGGTGIEGDTSIDRPADAEPDLPDSPLDSSMDPSEDTLHDSITDPTGDEFTPGPGITFTISFLTDIPGYEYLFVQSVHYDGQQKWVSALDPAMGGPIPLQSRCDICACVECTGCETCTADPEVVRVASGGSTSWHWDGVVYPVYACTPAPGAPEVDCQAASTMSPGAFWARFCWGIGGADAFPDHVITSPSCQDVAFAYPVPGGVVSYTVNNSG